MENRDSYLKFNVNNSFNGFQDDAHGEWKDEWAEVAPAKEIGVDQVSNLHGITVFPTALQPLPESDKSHLGLSGVESKQVIESEVLKDIKLATSSNSPKKNSKASLRQTLGVDFDSGISSLTTGSPHQSKSQTISAIQNVFNDSQKIAYVGLCYLSIETIRKKIKNYKKAFQSFEKWSIEFMEKLYVYLDLLPEERKMITDLAAHGLTPMDLSASLLQDSREAQKRLAERMENGQNPLTDGTTSMLQNDKDLRDIRFTIISHLFLMSIADGNYDSRARTVLRIVSTNLDIEYEDLVCMENFVADELRVYEHSEEVHHDSNVVEERNKVEGKRRWLYAGMVTLGGAALIGVTAGLAAPLIGAGIGAALTGAGVAQGVGVSAFMASSGGIALITSGGVLTGGSFSGKSIIKRTRGIVQFEFINLADAMELIKKHKAKRRQERIDSIKNDPDLKNLVFEQEVNVETGLNSPISASIHIPKLKLTNKASNSAKSDLQPPDILWEVNSTTSGLSTGASVALHAINDEENLDNWAAMGGDNVEDAVDPSAKMDEMEVSKKTGMKQTNVLLTISGWCNYDSDDHIYPYSTLVPGVNGDHYALIWETKTLQELGSTMAILAGEIASFIFQQGLQATVLPVLMGALTGPMWLLKLNYLVDNPWGNALSKAEKAGRLLADTLIGQVQSNRPVTLVGFSVGARLIYFCLLELAAKEAFGIIESVYLMGTPVVSSKAEWETISSIVAGKVYNCFTTNDSVLGVLYRASISSFKDVPGLSPVRHDIPDIVNVDLTDIVKGHMEYASQLPKILGRLGFVINSDHFIDQDDEIILWKAEVDAERQKSKEKKEIERKAQLEKLRQEQGAEAVRKRLAKEAETERRRLAKEAALAEKKRQELERAELASSAVRKTNGLTLDEIAQQELRDMAEMDKMMQSYWQPREISSTLPPLVISQEDLSKTMSSVEGKEMELKSEDGDNLSDF